MDDTNPNKEDVEYVDSITTDVKLIGGWPTIVSGLKPVGKTPETITSNGKKDFYLPAIGFGLSAEASAKAEAFYASDCFDQIYEYALILIKKGKAYVCDHTTEEVDPDARRAR